MTPPSVDTLFRSLRAAIEEVCNLKELLMEMDNRSTGIELKYKDLANKVRYLERCSMDATESLHRATQRNKGLTAALKSTVLDIWVGHCNNCGNKFDYDDETNSPHILEKCGAPWCHSCIQKRRRVCMHHSRLGTQQSHRLYSNACVICHEDQAQTTIDMECGHPVCRECLRNWLSWKHGMHQDDVVHSKVPYVCSLCQNREKACVLFSLPLVQHVPSYERARACAARQR
ncbi:hypothetical protein ACJQWK_08463 [Exserohilum turcicum]